MATIKLGLIGDHIERSQSPRLHLLAGSLAGIDVSYEPLIPADMGLDFDAVFARCASGGFRGVNITYPYKERVFERLFVADETVRIMGACNTVVFGGDRPAGHNTDYSGFRAAFRETFGTESPGVVAMAGAGGVGKAIGFALADLRASEIRVFDPDGARTAALKRSLGEVAPHIPVHPAESIAAAAQGADGIVNCTPVGMTGHPGTPIPRSVLTGLRWAFDAVYTPVETTFMREAAAAGLSTMSGYELFLRQGIDAFRIFTGHEVRADDLRALLTSGRTMERRAQ